jgi:hypothetical protein
MAIQLAASNDVAALLRLFGEGGATTDSHMTWWHKQLGCRICSTPAWTESKLKGAVYTLCRVVQHVGSIDAHMEAA